LVFPVSTTYPDKPRSPRLHFKRDNFPLSTHLAEDGWKTPNTYCCHFAPFPESPGVYLFLFSDLGGNPEPERVLYVGMSTNIARRQSGHEVYGEIYDTLEAIYGGMFHCARWFKEAPAIDLRRTEASLIKLYDPPYKIIHRVRGLLV
jgi:excinuclease UvrABC nuclease subunit